MQTRYTNAPALHRAILTAAAIAPSKYDSSPRAYYDYAKAYAATRDFPYGYGPESCNEGEAWHGVTAMQAAACSEISYHLPDQYRTFKMARLADGGAPSFKLQYTRERLTEFAAEVARAPRLFGGGKVDTGKAKKAPSVWSAGAAKLVIEAMESHDYTGALSLAQEKCGPLFYDHGKGPFMLVCPEPVEFSESFFVARHEKGHYSVFEVGSGHSVGNRFKTVRSKGAAIARAANDWQNLFCEDEKANALLRCKVIAQDQTAMRAAWMAAHDITDIDAMEQRADTVNQEQAAQALEYLQAMAADNVDCEATQADDVRELETVGACETNSEATTQASAAPGMGAAIAQAGRDLERITASWNHDHGRRAPTVDNPEPAATTQAAPVADADYTAPRETSETDELHDSPRDLEESAEFVGRGTYSPEDNKLRLHPFARLDAATYARVKAAGYAWAPKQGFFVAPAWSPARADVLAALCGEIEDEDSTMAERAEVRADRFEEYQGKRAQDAARAVDAVHAIGARFELGQPILIGHHSERRARKDKEKMDNGMRRAVQMWDTSEYWSARASSAVAHADYKERPDVRARRIKTLEAEQRKHQRAHDEAAKLHTFYTNPETETATTRDGRNMRAALLQTWEGGLSHENQRALESSTLELGEALRMAVASKSRTMAHYARWVQHLGHRIAYERAMLGESGGLVAQKVDIAIGGRVLVRGQWLTVLRLNKKAGELVSVTTNSRYVAVRGLDEIAGYEAPSAEEAAATAAKMKAPKLCNYPREDFINITQAQWDACGSGYKSTTRRIAATETQGAHRVRVMLGTLAGIKGDSNARYSYPFVYITDAKRTDPPAPAAAVDKVEPAQALATPAAPDCTEARRSETTDTSGLHDTPRDLAPTESLYDYTERVKDEIMQIFSTWRTAAAGLVETYADTVQHCHENQTPAADCARALDARNNTDQAAPDKCGPWPAPQSAPVCTPPLPPAKPGAQFEAMRQALKNGGAVVAVAPQLFVTPPELAARMVELLEDLAPGALVLEPSAGTGNLIAAVRAQHGEAVGVVAVEINGPLCSNLDQNFTGLHAICRADFLEWEPDTLTGQPLQFDAVVMNPPFVGGVYIQHITRAFGMLKPGGRLVAICAGGPRQARALQPLVEQHGGTWEPLPAGTFASSGTGVNTVLLSMTAPGRKEEPAPVDKVEPTQAAATPAATDCTEARRSESTETSGLHDTPQDLAPAFQKMAPVAVDLGAVLAKGAPAQGLVGIGVQYLGDAANLPQEGAIVAAWLDAAAGVLVEVTTEDGAQHGPLLAQAFQGAGRWRLTLKMHGAPYLAQLATAQAMATRGSAGGAIMPAMTYPEHMTGAELQTLREGCGLDRDEFAGLADVQARTVKHWENGRAGVPADVAQLARELDAACTQGAAAMLQRVQFEDVGAPEGQPVVLVRYKTPQDMPQGQNMPAGLQGAMVARVRLELLRKGRAVRVVWHDADQGDALAQLQAQALPHRGDQPATH